MSETMRAMGATNDGATLVEVAKPRPRAGEVRVKMIASAINPAEEKLVDGELLGRFLHWKTSPLVLGWDFSGTVDAVGAGVSDLAEGDGVWGHLQYTPTQKQGAFAEYITVARKQLAAKPDDVPDHLAAAAATVAMTALQSLRDLGRLAEGGEVLIIGAGGGVGSLAVGIAKRLGGRVTAVCSTKDVERVRAFGADEIIDRKKSDPFEAESAYDLVFDTPAVHSFGACEKLLKDGGTYVTTLPDAGLVSGLGRSIFTSKRCRWVLVESKRDDLELVGGWLSDGLEVPIDSRHKIADLGAALSRQRDPGRVGRVVVDIADGWS